jgi:hypothetical protein
MIEVMIDANFNEISKKNASQQHFPVLAHALLVDGSQRFDAVARRVCVQLKVGVVDFF